MSSNPLFLHCGAESIDRHQLALVPTPPPMGPRHQPYPYIDFVDRVADGLQTIGLGVVEERYGLMKDGSRFFGLMECRPIHAAMMQTAQGRERDYALMVGLRGSHDQSLARGLVAGSRVFVCDNLCFSGEVQISTKQTTHIERRLPGLILDAVRGLDGIFQVQDARFAQYRAFQVKPRIGDAIITELVRREVINPSHVGRLIREWDHPSHEEHAENGWSLWRMHNACTEALKVPLDDDGMPARAAAPMAMERTIGLTKLLDEVSHFDPRTMH